MYLSICYKRRSRLHAHLEARCLAVMSVLSDNNHGAIVVMGRLLK